MYFGREEPKQVVTFRLSKHSIALIDSVDEAYTRRYKEPNRTEKLEHILMVYAESVRNKVLKGGNK